MFLLFKTMEYFIVNIFWIYLVDHAELSSVMLTPYNNSGGIAESEKNLFLFIFFFWF